MIVCIRLSYDIQYFIDMPETIVESSELLAIFNQSSTRIPDDNFSTPNPRILKTTFTSAISKDNPSPRTK